GDRGCAATAVSAGVCPPPFGWLQRPPSSARSWLVPRSAAPDLAPTAPAAVLARLAETRRRPAGHSGVVLVVPDTAAPDFTGKRSAHAAPGQGRQRYP